MRKRAIVLVFAVAGAAVASCGGSSSSGGGAGSGGGGGSDGGAGAGGAGGGTSIALADLPAKLADALCAQLEKCASGMFSIYLRGMDCKTYLARQFEDKDLAATKKAIDGKTVVYHGDKAQACIDAFVAQGCDMFANRPPDICEQAIEGKVKIGDACTTDSECEGPNFCQVDAACPGKCAARLGDGGACADDDACQNGLVCNGGSPSSKGKCAKAPGAGDPCGGASLPDCKFGLLCVGGDDQKGTPGTCKTIAEVFAADSGAACDIQKGTWCKQGLYCLADSITPPATLVAKCGPAASSGGDCKFGVPESCPVGEYCSADIMKAQLAGKCTKAPPAGQPCGTNPFSQRCEAYARCDEKSTTCKAIERIGGACTSKDFCYSEKCSAGKCAAGDACPP